MMVKVRACRLPQDTLLIVGRGSRKEATLMAFLAYRQPSEALPILSRRFAFFWIADAGLARHGGRRRGVLE